MKRLFSIILLTAVLTFPMSEIAHAQASQWIYAIMYWDVSDGDFSWNISIVYDQANIETGRDTIENLWGIIEEANGGLVDYLAIFGAAGYELVSTTARGTDLIFIFKRST